MSWPSSIPSWTSGEVVTSADLNAIRDALKAIGDPWTAYTPTMSAATTDPALGTSSLTGSYRKLGHTADIHMDLVVGAGFTAGSGAYRFSLPAGVNPINNNASESFGYGEIRDATPAAGYPVLVYYISSTTVGLIRTDDRTVVTNTNPITWATGDIVSIHIPAMEIT